jgi:hypothetical protein
MQLALAPVLCVNPSHESGGIRPTGIFIHDQNAATLPGHFDGEIAQNENPDLGILAPGDPDRVGTGPLCTGLQLRFNVLGVA